MTVIDVPPVAPRRAMAADEVDHQSAQDGTAELVNGELVEKVVSEQSRRTEGWITTRLTMFTLTSPIASVYPGTLGYQVFQHVLPGDPGRVRKPDASVIRTERLRQLADPDPGYMPVVPDLAVEVVSPNDVWSDLVDKVREYQLAGFPLVWIADPGFRTLTVHRTGEKPAMLSGDDLVTAESALPGFACRVADLFPPPPAEPAP